MNLALIDADILVYEAAYAAQQGVEWEEGLWTHTADIRVAQEEFDVKYHDIMASTGSHESVLALTDSDRDANFRKAVWPAYKEPRGKVGSMRPLLYSALRAWVRQEYDVKQKHGIEADDTVGILATADLPSLPPRENRIICTVDKDLDTVTGARIYNWRKPELGIRYIDESTAFRALLTQTLTGDSTDNYPGCPGIGPKRALALLDAHEGEAAADVWAAVVEQFEKKGLTAEDALIQARCARILQAEDWDFENERPILWTPPTEGETK